MNHLFTHSRHGKAVARTLTGPLILGLFLWVLPGAKDLRAYPLDGGSYTGIARLEGYRLAQQKKSGVHQLPVGAQLNMSDVDLRLRDYPGLTLPEPDSRFTEEIRKLLGPEAERYGFAVLDLSDPAHPRYAEHRGSNTSNPGSVGKLLVALGVFQALADIYPNDPESRLRVLRTSEVTADGFILTDHHKVPLWNPETETLRHRPIKQGDRANLWTYLDWMLSASSNAAASMVMKHLMLLVHFGKDYPVTEEQADQFFRQTPKKQLGELLVRALQEPVTRNGLDLEHLRQGSFFTWEGKRRVPGTSSRASSRELARFLVRMEQGKLVDPFSSREIKRLLYMTERRIRYASSPALGHAAVYFKSGSLYKCQPEPEFECGKYKGNVVNMMNSVAVVEAPASERRVYYITVVLSNILRKNSAVEHQTFATRLHRLIESYHKDATSDSAKPPAGKSDHPVPQ